MKVNNLLFLLLIILSASCTQKKLPLAEYMRWVRDYENEIHKKKEVGNFTFDVQYKPCDFIIASEDADILKDKSLYGKRLNELNGFEYFSLKISDKSGDFTGGNSNSTAEANSRQYYYSFSFRDNIWLVHGDKKIPCSLFHYERSYDLTSAKTFVLGFSREVRQDEDITLLIDSDEIGLGPVKIVFSHSDLNNIPQIKI